MKASYKAALLSAFLCPGAGQFYLRKYLRGFLFMAFIFAGMAFVIWSAAATALARLDNAMVMMQGKAVNVKEAVNAVGLNASDMPPYYNAVLFIMMCCWFFAVIDAYQLGKRKERTQYP
ncbi:MAG: hypothetical protein JW943_11270 [Deltaproteobacteria bacterium]|nr:hypothetical protein [Deltaproteobacteria bacterium]